jgi:hypothetical protein
MTIPILRRLILAGLLTLALSGSAQTINWKGHTWILKSARSEGPGPNQWNPRNVFVDTNGYLHLRLTYDAARKAWDCAELWTTDKLGFGTYQWQVESRIDEYDPWVVLGLFPYGPPELGPDGSNEIDIEYALWGKAKSTQGGFTLYPNSGTNIDSHKFFFKLGGDLSTSRFNWSSKGVEFWLMDGLQPPGSTNQLLHTWNYTPANAARDIPQHPMPLHLNLWLFRGHPPADGRNVEVVIRDFTKT